MAEELAGLTVAIYARFSSDGQRDASIDDQVRRCRDFVSAAGGTVRDDMVFVDRAMSGAGGDRPRYESLIRMATAKPREVDVIVVEDLSRLSRAAADLLTLQRLFEFAQVRLVGVADHIDTASSHSKLTFGVKSIISDYYLVELADKTRRGLDGRARAGFATGGVAYGFSLRKVTGPDGKEVGSEIQIEQERAAVVRRIFGMYLEGQSVAAIAKKLNADRVDPPRVYAARRRAGWKDSTIRNILHNETYTGVWTYGERRWRKLPGTNKRRPMSVPGGGTKHERPHLRIVPDETWSAVQSRLAAVAAHYTRTKEGSPKGRSVAGRATPYLFSGLLHCGACGAKVVVSGGSSATYYRCESHSKRGTCANALSVRENVLRTCLLDELRRRLCSEDGIARARRRLAERLGELTRENGDKVRERRARLDKVEREIGNLIDFVAAGRGTQAVSTRLKALELGAAAETKALAGLERALSGPIKLPDPKKLVELAFDLERRLNADVQRGREELRRLFRDGRIDLLPQPGGFYVARSELLPLVLLSQNPPEVHSGGQDQVPRYSAVSCAGRI